MVSNDTLGQQFALWYCSVRNAEVIPFSTAILSWSCLACSLHTRELPTRYSFTLCRTNQTRFKVIIMSSPSVPVGLVSDIIIVIVTKTQQSNKTKKTISAYSPTVYH